MKRHLFRTLLCSACLLAAILPARPAFATEKISKVTLRFDTDGYDDFGYPELSAESGSVKYSVSDPELADGYYTGDDATAYEGREDVYVVELSADEGYYFSVYKSADISMRGLDPVLIKASRQDNGQTLIVVVKLDGLGSALGGITEASWQADGHATWEAAHGATLYKMQMTDPNGNIKYLETGGTSYDFNPLMQNAGTYSYRVKPTNADKNGEWIDGGTFGVSEELAAANRAAYEVAKEVTYTNGIKRPDTMVVKYTNIGWQEDEDGRYWYRNQDGSYLQSVWRLEGENWYYFDADGYMVTGTVTINDVEYTFDEDGKLAES